VDVEAAAMRDDDDVRYAGTPHGIELAYETFGDPGDPPVVLVMGLGTQMLGWDEGFCRALARHGLFVVRFDNRDIGLSTHLDDAPPGDVMAFLGGDRSSVAYTLTDMAADTLGLLDALGLDSAHLVGASMGGMIAQTVAIEEPARVRSLVSIMSTTGDRAVGHSSEAATAALLAPAARTREEAVQRTLASSAVIGSPGFARDEAAIRRRVERAYDRRYDPAGVGRQLVGVYASPDRTEGLRRLDLPVLVIHGADDPLIDVSGGRATAAAIPGAELVVIDGMGHDLPAELWETIAGQIAGFVAAAEGARRAA
jgi:pimeloyl-ACP methyl ester carboxylesterase